MKAWKKRAAHTRSPRRRHIIPYECTGLTVYPQERFKARSKGKDISGELPGNALATIKAANAPDKRRPFARIKEDALAHRIEYYIGKLHTAGKIGAAYSCHDFRHFFAVTEYRKDKDIKRAQGLLFHSGIQITDRYLRGLGVV